MIKAIADSLAIKEQRRAIMATYKMGIKRQRDSIASSYTPHSVKRKTIMDAEFLEL